MLVYLCTDPLNPANVGESGPCHTVSDAVSDCRGGLLIGAWAVGGEVCELVSTLTLKGSKLVLYEFLLNSM